MTYRDLQDNGIIRSLIKYFLIIVGALGVLAVIVRLAELYLAVTLYSWFFEKVREYSGFPDLLSGAIAIWLAVAAFFVLPTLAYSIFFRKKKGIVLLALIFSVFCVGLYFLQQPREGLFFNPITGKARFKYAEIPDGSIELFPLGYNYHPRYSTKLKSITPEIVIKYEKQVQGVYESRASEPTQDLSLGKKSQDVTHRLLVDEYIKVLENDRMSDYLRKDAAGELARLGDKKATLALIKVLDAEDIYIRAQAVRSLGILRDNRAIPALVKLVANDRSADVRYEAGIALRLINGELK